MLSVNAPSCTFDFLTQKPSPLSFIVSTARDNFPDHMKSFSRPAMKPPRGVVPTPPRSSKEAAQEKTRQTFFKKVRRWGDERTWQSRSDLILRADYEAQRKRWEEGKARSAPDMATVPEDEEIEIKLRSPSCGKGGMEYLELWSISTKPPLSVEAEMEIAEAIQHQEDQELDALISLLEESDSATRNNDLTEYGSDEDDFPWMCMEVIATADAGLMEKSPDSLPIRSDDMDMSIG